MGGDQGGVARRLQVLNDAIWAFSEVTTDPRALLATIARRTAEALDAGCSFSMVSEDGESREPVADFDPDPTRRTAIEPENVLSVTLRAHGSTIGYLRLVRHGATAGFEDADVQLAQSLADHAALAITNARMFVAAQHELAQRTRLEEQLRMLSQLAQEFAAATGDYRGLLDLIARRFGEVVGDACVIRVIGADREHLEDGALFHPTAGAFADLRHLLHARHRIGEGFAGQVVASGQSLLVPSLSAANVDASVVERFRPVVERLGIASLIAVPLRAHASVFGVAVTCRTGPEHPYTEDDLRMVEDIAAHASLAISNAQLLEASRKELHDRMQIEEVLRRGFLEAAPDAVLIANPAGEIVLVNSQAEAMFGYERAELLGSSIELLVPMPSRAVHVGQRAGYLGAPVSRPKRSGVTLSGLRKDGSVFAAEISLSPIETPEGTLVAAAIRDVTERRREAEERSRRMQEANRLKSEFLANMSHELRTPLNAIIGFSALMHDGKAGPVSTVHKEYLGDILNSSRHLLQLINDVLDLAKVESGRTELRVESVELDRVAGEVRDILRGLAAERRIQLTLELDAALPRVTVDQRMLKQILYNFLSNAIKFTNDRGQVWLRIGPEGDDEFRIDVEDTGIGVKPEDLDRLFVEFQQLDASAAKRYPGTGLGLALTRRIVEAQGGRVLVKSEPGKGSTFSAILPREVRTAKETA